MIPSCTTCGAQLGPQEMNCRYCGTPTPLSHHRQWHDKHAAAARSAAMRIEAETVVNKNATFALIAALSNILCCMFGLPGVIAIVLGVRTRSLARAHGLVVPGRALAAIGIGGFSLVSAIALWISVGLDMKHASERREDLRRRVDKSATHATLNQDTACWLVELRLLEQGYEGSSSGIEHVHCDGKLVQEGERATLDEVTFMKSSQSRKVTACFKHGGRWTVDKLTTSARCDEPESPPAAATQGGAAPASTGAGKRKTDER